MPKRLNRSMAILLIGSRARVSIFRVPESPVSVEATDSQNQSQFRPKQSGLTDYEGGAVWRARAAKGARARKAGRWRGRARGVGGLQLRTCLGRLAAFTAPFPTPVNPIEADEAQLTGAARRGRAQARSATSTAPALAHFMAMSAQAIALAQVSGTRVLERVRDCTCIDSYTRTRR